jgi:hypothetical protein
MKAWESDISDVLVGHGNHAVGPALWDTWPEEPTSVPKAAGKNTEVTVALGVVRDSSSRVSAALHQADSRNCCFSRMIPGAVVSSDDDQNWGQIAHLPGFHLSWNLSSHLRRGISLYELKSATSAGGTVATVEKNRRNFLTAITRDGRRTEYDCRNLSGSWWRRWEETPVFVNLNTGKTAATRSGSHWGHKASGILTLPSLGQFRFPVTGANRENAVMSAIDESGKRSSPTAMEVFVFTAAIRTGSKWWLLQLIPSPPTPHCSSSECRPGGYAHISFRVGQRRADSCPRPGSVGTPSVASWISGCSPASKPTI